MVGKNSIQKKILLKIKLGKWKDLNVCWLRSQTQVSFGGWTSLHEVAAGQAAWKLSCDLGPRLICQHYCWRLDLLL